ncbi:HAMP domain-containing sensor histidine kinase [Paenibacillus sp. S150]|uniref:HAMP domain-containing sensor histidine kinase n=1 Tax=Paenibacillus sp. S150 TaxID=2749826 RepID=UPI001C565584|nr:HAMP domain-containing sensor histidine kinase [Paenibacillus sp. S150]MBW4080707.1 HAMP domain-containing histidine kinase [Paenibacillus sp. S150]
MLRKLLGAFAAAAAVIGISLFVLLTSLQENAPPDRVAINGIVKQTERNWGTPELFQRIPGPLEYAVLDQDGKLLFQSKAGLSRSVNEALKNRETPMDLTVDGQVVGKVIVHNDDRDVFSRWKRQFALASGAAILLLLLLGLLYISYLNRMIIRPFGRMQRFARHIARGELDFPLEMDRDHLFGAFTESFDIMREELAAARRNEYLANKSKKELVAGLSHDIKTPVASIKAITELLQVSAVGEKTGRQLGMLYSKADQIDRLVTDMFHSTLEELNELQVKITEENSSLLKLLIANADYSGIVSVCPVPECIIAIDAVRLQQVVDNIVHNARKYAGTGIDIAFFIREGYLEMELADYGAGVPEEELPFLFNKYFRGSRSEHQSGAGLGLYLSRHLMRRMHGEIEGFNRPGGFTVRLHIPLAGKV